jgi:HD superfamily phosphohydrolase YqeK
MALIIGHLFREELAHSYATPSAKKGLKHSPKITPEILHQMFDCTVAALWSCVNDQILESLRCHPFGHALTLTWLLCGFLRQIGGFPHCVYF